MSHGRAADAEGAERPGVAGWPRRLVCVSVNAAIDKTAAVERLVPGEIHRPDLLTVLPGGKALNVARAARTLGLDACVVAVLGGHAGDWMEEALATRGIRTRAVRVAGETRTCLSVLDRSSGALTELYEAGLTLDPDGWAAVEAAVRSELRDDPEGTLVVVSGSMPPGSPADGCARLAALAAGAGARAAVDVDGAHLAAALAAAPWLVKVNAREAGAATGSRPRTSRARGWLQRRSAPAAPRWRSSPGDGPAPSSWTSTVAPGGSGRRRSPDPTSSAVATRSSRAWPRAWRPGIASRKPPVGAPPPPAPTPCGPARGSSTRPTRRACLPARRSSGSPEDPTPPRGARGGRAGAAGPAGPGRR